MRLFSTEQVTKYHPDKYADQISDAVLDACLNEDINSRVACECMVKGETVILAGEITTKANPNYAAIVNRVAKKLGYKASNIITYIDHQSPEIANGVDAGGAGDQGMMYGAAFGETESLLPYGFDLANKITAALEDEVATPGSILLGDAKCQVTTDLDAEPGPDMVERVLVSACHRKDTSVEEVRRLITSILYNLGIDNHTTEIIVNPAGVWTLGGPVADCGLTGRKIVCDQYGGYTPVGGGAFSGKDPTKVDRSGAYMARKIACDLLKQHELPYCGVQLAYGIGLAHPVSVIIDTPLAARNAAQAEEVMKNYDLTPNGIIKALNLHRERYETLAEGCHFREGGIIR